jgi:hypothetical protein
VTFESPDLLLGAFFFMNWDVLESALRDVRLGMMSSLTPSENDLHSCC